MPFSLMRKYPSLPHYRTNPTSAAGTGQSEGQEGEWVLKGRGMCLPAGEALVQPSSTKRALPCR